jgi:low affinity Fe/Cu permease
MIVIRGDFMDTSSYIFLAIYWVGIIIWSLKNKEKAKKELLQLKNNWKTGVSILLIVLFPFLVMASMIFVL